RACGGPPHSEVGSAADDRLWLFQTRPITAMPAVPPRRARLLGPGPVAETFPGVLQPLEEDLWLAPMSYGLTLALDVTGSAPRGKLRNLPVVTTVELRAGPPRWVAGGVTGPRALGRRRPSLPGVPRAHSPPPPTPPPAPPPPPPRHGGPDACGPPFRCSPSTSWPMWTAT
ncbi:hypothetical protein ACFVZ2_38650, partial [Streptomyces lasiicapitis]